MKLTQSSNGNKLLYFDVAENVIPNAQASTSSEFTRLSGKDEQVRAEFKAFGVNGSKLYLNGNRVMDVEHFKGVLDSLKRASHR